MAILPLFFCRTVVIKKDEILRSGATSIVEALRLAPGVIVREITPGNFDIHIRGFDDITKTAFTPLPYNTTTLVMVDNMIVYSYFSGGTSWEILPVDIHDVERIEVVRGPTSALYGPNAASGVINIITSHSKKQGLNSYFDCSAGVVNSKMVRGNIGYNWHDKTKITFSGNYTERSRFNNDYFDWKSKQYISIDDLSMIMEMVKDTVTHSLWTAKDYRDSLDAKYDINTSLRKMGGNLFFSHNFTEQIKIDISMGAANAQAQKSVFMNYITPLSEFKSDGYYADVRLKIHNLYGQFNYTTGNCYSNYRTSSYKHKMFTTNFEYDYHLKNFYFRPGVSYKFGTIDSPFTSDEPMDFVTLNYQFKDQPRELIIWASSLLSEWEPNSRLRIIGGLRLDKCNISKRYELNYEIASTFRINKNNLVRLVRSKATRSPFILNPYLNAKDELYWPVRFQGNSVDLNVPIKQSFSIRRDNKFPTINSSEFCWRSKFTSKVGLDIELFSSIISNLVVSNIYREVHTYIRLDQQYLYDSVISCHSFSQMIGENFDIKAHQSGATLSLHIKPGEKFDLKIYGTIQKTKLTGITDVQYTTTGGKFIMDSLNRILYAVVSSRVNPTNWSTKATPSFYGGFLMNYKPGEKINLAIDGYLVSKQVFAGIDFHSIAADVTGKNYDFYMTLKAYANVNFKISYNFFSNANAYISVRNLLGEHREYGFTDTIGSLLLVGINWRL